MTWLPLLLAACSAPPPTPVVPQHTAPVRLVQVFDDAHWVQAPSAPPPREVVWSDGFEDDDLGAWEHTRPKKGVVSRVHGGAEGEWAVQITPRGEVGVLTALTRTVLVTSNHRYRVAVQVKTEDLGVRGGTSEGATLSLVEVGEDGSRLTHQNLQRLRGDTPWRTLETSFRTNRKTRSIELQLVPAKGRARGKVLFDDVVVEALSEAEELDHLPAWTEHARPVPHRAVKGVTVGPDFRPAIVTAAPSSFGFEVLVPEGGGQLRFAWALGPGTEPRVQVCFEVAWADEPVGVLWDQCLAGRKGRRWSDVDLPLERGGVLTFSVTASPSHHDVQAFWADVRVETPLLETRPNVALIVLDTLRADHLGSHGYSARPTTPALDAFAKRAIRYDRVYAPSPWTAPSLGSIVTGLYPSQHRAGTRVLRENAVTRSSVGQKRKNQLNYRGMGLERETLGELFADAGYETVGFQTNYFYSEGLGFARGFGRYIQYKGSSTQGARAGLGLAKDWLDDREDTRPFLLTAHFIDPHSPYRMRRPFTEGFGIPEGLPDDVDTDPDLPAVTLRRFGDASAEHADAIRALYDADVRWLDDALAELLPLLEREDTLIVVVSDHGEAFHEHGKFAHGHGLYEELLQVPLLMRLPGGQWAGTVDSREASLLDLYPTLLELAGLDVPRGGEGVSLLGEPESRPRPGLLAEAMYDGPDRTAWIDGDWKYLYTHPPGLLGFHRAGVQADEQTFSATEELYDLARDPGERTDLLSREPERAAAMRATVHGWLASTWPALHLRCTGVEGELVVETSESIGQVSPFSLEPGDGLALDTSRHRLTLEIGDDPDWLAVQLLQPGATLSVSGLPVSAGGTAGTSWRLGTDELPDHPPAEGPGCVVWEVPMSGGEGLEVDEETLRELEALGYVE